MASVELYLFEMNLVDYLLMLRDLTVQEQEVDRLLYESRTEMHSTFQRDGHSNSSPSQLKPASGQVEGKKRERVDHIGERQCASKTEYGTENELKCKIARITEDGGVVDFEGVEELVQLMGAEIMEKRMDLARRSILTGVLAETYNVDCLHGFVQLRGLPILDEWLRDIVRGNIGDANGKDSAKTVDEFLVVLLRALDKLPLRLQDFNTCIMIR